MISMYYIYTFNLNSGYKVYFFVFVFIYFSNFIDDEIEAHKSEVTAQGPTSYNRKGFEALSPECLSPEPLSKFPFSIASQISMHSPPTFNKY